ncbi:MAG TPA: hypothetical protein ENN30_00345 [Candidatus Woesearchaeota archaeon]|nr:hypothetical protein [Candidatus Woesearchaeota archaeon]
MTKLKFEMLEKKCKDVAEEFMEELELLPIFFNYYPEVRRKWLEEIGLNEKEILIVSQVAEEYARRKVALQNKKIPKKRKQVINIENDILQEMYEGRLMVVKSESPLKTSMKILKQQYEETAILDPRELEELENITLFKEHKKRFPWNFLIFDSNKMKIIGIKVVEENKCEV